MTAGNEMDLTTTRRFHRNVVGRIAASVVALLVAGSAAAQDAPEMQVRQHFELGKPRMTIYVIGATGAPGIWLVNTDISFVEMLAITLPEGVGTLSLDVVQNSAIELYRSDNSGRRLVYSQDLREVLKGLAPSPTLQHNDLLLFETITRPRRRITFRGVTSTIGTAASMLLLYLRLRDAT